MPADMMRRVIDVPFIVPVMVPLPAVASIPVANVATPPCANDAPLIDIRLPNGNPSIVAVPVLLPLLVTMGLGALIQNALYGVFGSEARSLADALGELSWASWTLPGDIIVGDQDGLLAFHPSEAPQVIAKAQAQALKEAETMLAMKEGRWDRSFIAALEARCAN